MARVVCELDHTYLRVVVKVAVVISHRAGAGGSEPGQGILQDRLPGTIWPYHSQEAAVPLIDLTTSPGAFTGPEPCDWVCL